MEMIAEQPEMKPPRYLPFQKSVEPHFSLQNCDGHFKIRCTTLDFDDKLLKPRALNPHTLILQKNTATLYQKQEADDSGPNDSSSVISTATSRASSAPTAAEAAKQAQQESQQILFDALGITDDMGEEISALYSMQAQDDLTFHAIVGII